MRCRSSLATAANSRHKEVWVPRTGQIHMAQLTESVARIIDEFAKLPGIGRKSAERLAYHLLRVHKTEAFALADAIRNVRENVRYCDRCYNLSEDDRCEVSYAAFYNRLKKGIDPEVAMRKNGNKRSIS